ncbi:hypothetical protein K6L44_03355 [Gluconacetobacter entanii]|uniref:ApeA N-terminal domain 1-containing protein n=1 Tax=Gluconacetobacter entanii TaxID=108528 RepID=UPI001C931C71|nr:HEPN domain-containing protein [Gluconacetobacter entanii]MBY4639054.1 hypothetical protein [Gluconacetobacter entanii]MCW4579498.1 hypothetical protein [Gluconacetobacter entanii]MCW4582905.1 hypothetical protein [Gluconacetobacter entanii]MCW4586330.1 hypothetical protein [Gluconacetobacter entanii]
MRKNDHNSELKNFDIELYHDQLGRLGSGVLSFGDNQWACVNLLISDNALELRTDDAKFDLVKAVTNEGSTFCLCDCKANGIVLYADYVIEGDLKEAAVDSISVRYSDVSEWFLRWRKVDGSVGKTLNWTRIPKDINVSVETDDEHFDLRSAYCSSHSQLGEDLVLHEHVEFIFSARASKFSLTDVKAKTHELSCLLSILLAYPATIISVVVSQGSGRSYRIYFPTFERPERAKDDSSFWVRCFIQQPALDGRWQSIFNHYYQSNYRKVCWVRLSGMQRYDGFWEYKALGYVSLLDSYLNIRFDRASPSESIPPSSKKITKFRQYLTKELPTMLSDERDKIVEIANKTFASTKFNFESKYRLAIQETDTDITKIINLSEDEFSLIKKVRNSVAHGDDHGLEQEQFPVVIRAESKIALLLTYWAFLDFGLTTQEFITCLEKTHSKLKLAAMIDTVHMDRVTGSAEFFSITIEEFQLLQRAKGLRFHGCCIEDDRGNITFSEEYTKMYKDWMHDPTKTSNIQDPERIFGVSKSRARLVNKGYFECKEDNFQVYYMWIIK